MKNVIAPKPDLVINNIEDTDSYKYSHFLQYPKGMTSMMSYLESRGGEWDECTLFGLQVLIHKYLVKKFTSNDIIEEEKWALAHGVPFNRSGWEYVLDKYNGYIPATIRAIPEGLVIPIKNVIMTIELSDEHCFWIVNWLETKVSRVWGPSTIAILSREIKKVWMHYLKLSSDNPEAEIGFKHHDFGSRGVTCLEQAGMHGAAHLLNFFGSDTVAGIKYANYYYDCPMSGFSIPATEHSTMTVWGLEPDCEYNAVKNWITKTLVERQVPEGLPKLSACVGDSRNIYNFVRMICTTDLKDLIKSSGGKLVIRPDSGDPIIVLGGIFDILEQCLGNEITVNSKGCKMLPPYLGVIQGDGINRHSMKDILHHVVVVKGWSASNIAMGSGGGLLQDVNRDTQKYAFKCCHAIINGVSVDVRKDPITDSGKKSKAGRLDLIKTSEGYQTIVLKDNEASHPDSVMNTVYENGDILYHTTLEECRARMAL